MTQPTAHQLGQQFQQRIVDDLLALKQDFITLVEDHGIYWQVQDLIKSNHRLLDARSCFFDMMNESFSYWAAMRVRRIVDRDPRAVSLLRLLEEIASHVDMMDGGITVDDVRQDIVKLESETKKIKDYVDQHVAHCDRNPIADIPLNRELSHAIKVLQDMFHKYYGLLRHTDIDLRVSYLEDPLAIFDYAWRTTPPSTSLF